MTMVVGICRPVSLLHIAVLASLGALVSTSAAAGPQFTATPASGAFDEPISVRVTGAEPGATVSVRAEFIDHSGTRWTAEGQYSADVRGEVHTESDESIGGTFTGAGAAQLLCSVLPVSTDELAAHIAALANVERPRMSPQLPDARPLEITISAVIAGTALPASKVVRAYADGTTFESVDTPEVKGLYYAPRTGKPGIPVLVVGGSGGGVPWQQAALLATRGHPALALAYFGYKDLPLDLAEVPIERFAAGARWLREKAAAKSIAVLGTSRGSEAAQLLAVHFPEGIDRLVLIAPSHLVHAGLGTGMRPTQAAWTLHGEPIPYVPTGGSNAPWMRAYREQSQRAPGYVGTPYYLPSWNSPEIASTYGIPIERFSGKVLAIAGDADTMWPSSVGAARMRERMQAHGRGDSLEILLLAGAGHAISNLPFANAMSGFAVHPVTRSFVSVGGVPSRNCAAKFSAWTRILQFLG